MLHYHVWFNLKPGISETRGLKIVSAYLDQLSVAAQAVGFRLLKNAGSPPRSKLPNYHALVEFFGPDELGAAMKKQAERGVHSGEHGQMVDVVCDFHVEIFTTVDLPGEVPALSTVGNCACEI